LCILAVLFSVSICAPQNSRVTSVPGFSGHIPFDQYAGYFDVNDGKKTIVLLVCREPKRSC